MEYSALVLGFFIRDFEGCFMAQYDGSVRINTNIRVKEAEVQLEALENRMRKTADRITSLRSKMDALKNAKIPTQEYKDISEQIAKATAEFNRLLEKQEQMKRTGKDHGAAWDELNRKMDEARNTIKYAKDEMQNLIDTGKAFTLGADTGEYTKLGQQLQYAESEMSVLNQKHDIQEMKLKKEGKGYRDLAGKAKSAFNSIGNVLKKTNATVDAFGRKIKETAQKHLPFFRKETEKAKTSTSGFAGRLKSLALSLLIFNQVGKAFRTLSSSISVGFTNMYNDDVRFKASIDSLRASVLTLQNAFAAAFRPIVEIAVPYIQRLVEWLTAAVNLAGQFFAALTGRKTYTRAIKQTAKASEEAAEAAEEETDAMQKQLSPLDKLNNLTSENNKKKDKGKDDSGAGTGLMFEEVPIDSKIQDMADKVKDILSKLFAPLKEAWEREGKFVIDSWKYGLKEVWKLIKDIGRDFLEVWQQEETVKIFEDLLHIIGDIGLVIGHLARNFRDAWNENKTGLRILENIRDIIGVIVHNFRLAADETVKWADKLDFGPLLETFERFTKSLIPLADALSGILSDFYTQVLLPLGKWTLEKSLPELLDVFTAFNNKVDWQALRDNLKEFWQHLEPFAETVGEGLIIFIERVSDALADFINSEAFDNFLTKIEEWMDSVSPQEVADGFEKIAIAIIALKGAGAALTFISIGVSALSGVANALKGVLSLLSGAISGLGGAISFLMSPIGLVVAAVAALAAGFVYGYQTSEEFRQKVSEIKDKFVEFWQENLKPMLEEWGQKFKELWKEHLKPCIDSLMELLKALWEDVLLPIAGWIVDTILPVLLPIIDEVFNTTIELIGWVIDVIGGLFDVIKDTVGFVADLLRGDWSGAWEHAENIVERIWDGITGTIQRAVEKITGWIDTILSLFDKAESRKSSFNMGTGVAGGMRTSSARAGDASRMVSPYAANPVIAALADMPIPGYATGQVIPRSMRQHLAILGDNTRETEVVSPLSTIEQAVINAMAKVGGVGTGGGSLTVEIPVILNGNEIGRAVQKFDAEFLKQNGRHAFA